MPFLRRRGNMASETDIRRHTFGLSSSKPPQPQLPPMSQPAIDAETVSNSDTESANGSSDAEDAGIHASGRSRGEILDHDSDDPSDARPDTPPVQEETQKHRRFSALRFRNASDSQLSLKARKQAEKPPPLPPPRECRFPHSRCLQLYSVAGRD
jgi:hypothetical protein